MKVTNPDVIKTGEKDLIESIKDDIDFSVIKEILIEKIKNSSFDIKDGAISFDVSGGEIVVHNGQIAFKIDFQLQTEMAVMFDRNGNYIPDRYQPLSNKAKADAITYQTELDEISNQHKLDKIIGDNLEEDQPLDELDLETADELDLESVADELDLEVIADELEKEHSPDHNQESDSDEITYEIEEDDYINEFEKRSDPIADLNDPVTDLGDPIADLNDPVTDLGDPIADLSDSMSDFKELAQDDDIEKLLRESRDFWVNP